MSARKLTTVKAVNAEDSLRRRSESSVLIRKEKRNEHLDKKRGIYVEEAAVGAVPPIPQSPELAFRNPGMGPATVPANVFGVGGGASPGGQCKSQAKCRSSHPSDPQHRSHLSPR